MALVDAIGSGMGMLNGTCDFSRANDGVRDSLGNITKSWYIAASDVPVSIQPMVTSGKEKFQVLQYTQADYMVFSDVDADFIPRPTDRIENYTRPDGVQDGKVYEIVSVLDDGGEGHHWYIGANVMTAGATK